MKMVKDIDFECDVLFCQLSHYLRKSSKLYLATVMSRIFQETGGSDMVFGLRICEKRLARAQHRQPGTI
jgi:hypothetical protein